jgi:hypothetical protein
MLKKIIQRIITYLKWLKASRTIAGIVCEASVMPNPKLEMKMGRKEEFEFEFTFINGLGFDPWIVYTHAYHECGGFKKVIGNYNFWGIKKPKAWTGKVIQVLTHEYINGEKIETYADFIDFNDIKGAIIWYANFISRMYPEAWKVKDNYQLYFPALVSFAHIYATDPVYSTKLIRLYNLLNPFIGEGNEKEK